MELTPRAKKLKWLTTGGVDREDSDDELGVDDVPWDWIYDETASQEEEEQVVKTPTRKRKARALVGKATRRIIGARTGDFECFVGDAVLLRSPEAGKDWVGIISHFSEVNEDQEEEMNASIMWFCSPEELSRNSKKARLRTDLLRNESFITADFNLNPLPSISGKAFILSKDQFFRKYPNGKQPRAKAAAAQYHKTILCRRGIKQRNGRYTEEFDWAEKYQGIADLYGLVNWINDQTKGRGKPIHDTEDYQDIAPAKGEDIEPSTPKKRRKTGSAVNTPSSSRKTQFITPTHKRITIKKSIEITPLGTRIISPNQLLSSPYQQARSNLHVAAVPSALPCREKEFSTVYKYLHDAIVDGTGACIYIAGTPGTGKTATVREVVAQLSNAVMADELDDFNFVEINGMKVTDPHQSYSILWEAIQGDRVSPTNALDLLEHEFSHPSPRRVPCVVLMDELDQLVTKSQSVMYNFFNWPQLRHSRLIVLAVANTMDLPERTLSNKISSRLGLTTITFPGYDHRQLMAIITSRLANVPGNIVDADAIQFAARKVAVVTGDARRALDICRRAVEMAEQAAMEEAGKDDENQDPVTDTPSKKSKNVGQAAAVSTASKARVTIATIKAAILESTSTPLAQHLRSISLSSKLFLAALLARLRRTGVTDTTFGEVLVEARRITDGVEDPVVGENLVLTAGKGHGMRAQGMGVAAGELWGAGIVAMEGKGKGERAGKIRLRVAEEEVRAALRGDVEGRALGVET